MTKCTAALNISEKLGAEPNQRRQGFVFLGRAAFARRMTHRAVLLARKTLLLQPLSSPCLSEPFFFSMSSPIGAHNESARNTLTACVSTIRSVRRRSLPSAKLKANITAPAGFCFGPPTLMRRIRPTESRSANKCPLMRRQDFSPIRKAKLHPLGEHGIEYFN